MNCRLLDTEDRSNLCEYGSAKKKKEVGQKKRYFKLLKKREMRK